MKQLVTFLALLLVHVLVFSQTEHKIFYDNGNLKQVGQFDANGNCTGEWKYYGYSGKLEKVGNFLNQQQIGEWFFYIDGYLYNIANYKDGVIQTDNWYHKNGKTLALGQYKDGKKTGKWKFYQESGALKQIERYKDGKEDGNWVWFYSNNQIACRGKYKKGLKTKVWRWYYENGNLKNVSNYVNGKRNGQWKWYNENGVLLEMGQFKSGDKRGQWKLYNENGYLTETRNY